MSQFQEKVFAACAKKEALFNESLGRYALRSMLAGAYLTMSTAVGIIGADIIATGIPALSRFVFAFIFAGHPEYTARLPTGSVYWRFVICLWRCLV